MSHYESYTWIQKHMQISQNMYDIDQLGKHLIHEIAVKKNMKTGKQRSLILSKEYEQIYNSINDTINVWRFKSRLYLTLQYYLDEALFNGIDENEEFFYIGDESYELTKLYFNQESWIHTQDPQKCQLFNTHDLNVEEALLLRCFFSNYENMMKYIEKLIEGSTASFKAPIIKVLSKIRQKHTIALSILEDLIARDIDDVEDHSHKN